ncbi:MAG: hypothetical protein QM747_07440 [Nocardioides sp.]
MFSLFLQDAWKVLVYSVILGAGLPIVYALGIRSLALGSGAGTSEVEANPARNPVGAVLAAICFLVVVAGVGVGLTYVIAAGKGEMLSFSHGYPTIVPKS